MCWSDKASSGPEEKLLFTSPVGLFPFKSLPLQPPLLARFPGQALRPPPHPEPPAPSGSVQAWGGGLPARPGPRGRSAQAAQVRWYGWGRSPLALVASKGGCRRTQWGRKRRDRGGLFRQLQWNTPRLLLLIHMCSRKLACAGQVKKEQSIVHCGPFQQHAPESVLGRISLSRL